VVASVGAYTSSPALPIDHRRLVRHPAVRGVAKRNGITPAQVALAWVLRQPSVCALPKSGLRRHVYEKAAARGITLILADRRELDDAFAPPLTARPLETG
jgi:diketogulonate reductase-like aldo/keto reductase